jgi:hypothetical protein
MTGRPPQPPPGGLPAFRVDERFVEALADALADHVSAQIRDRVEPNEGYMNAEAAARYLGVTRKRIHDLASSRRLVPDGHDGRTPLYRRETLDTYVREGADP